MMFATTLLVVLPFSLWVLVEISAANTWNFIHQGWTSHYNEHLYEETLPLVKQHEYYTWRCAVTAGLLLSLNNNYGTNSCFMMRFKF